MLTVAEVAARLHVAPKTVRRWIGEGKLGAVRLGGDKTGYRIALSEIERFLAARRVQPQPDDVDETT